MQAPNPTRSYQSLWILLALVVCICLLISLETFRPKHTQETLVAEAETAVIPSQQPSPTPEPVKEAEPTVTPGETPTPAPSATERPLAQTATENDPYPELYGDNPEQVFQPADNQIVYLTFDDGPSTSTPMLLDVLREEGVTATFFVAGTSNFKRELLKRIHEENHVIGVHTLTHNYQYIYESIENYLADFSAEYHQIWEATGYRPRIFRFPGGSVNSKNKHLCRDLIWEMNRRGFVYFDWNVTSEDAVGVEDPKEQLAELITQSGNRPRIIALLHDSDQNPDIGWVVKEYIHHMRELGYRFESLDSTVAPMKFPF
ncbi:MAG: polysaccharide deacetylase family protein [Clostridia bacterium]|nr:polysaccharide deacetylase family protein [Clostridia bacterium]